jgi:cytochrome c5
MRLRLLTLLGGAALIGALVVASVALAGGNPANKLHANLTGGQVVPGGSGAPAGAGNARITLRPKKQKICFRITYKKIGPRKGLNAAIYKGKKGQNGSLVQTLFSGKRSSPVKGCAKNVSKDDMKAIRAKPRQFNVAVKNAKYPNNGAIRGQLKQRQ